MANIFLSFLQVYMIFGTFCLAAFVHVFLLFQETQGKSLEEIDHVFDNGSIWAFKVKHHPEEFKHEIEHTKQLKVAGLEPTKIEVEVADKRA